MHAIFTARFPLHNLRCNDKLRNVDNHLMQEWQHTSLSRSGRYLTEVEYSADVAELEEADVVDDGHSIVEHELQRHHAIRAILEQSPKLRCFRLRTSPKIRPVQAFDVFAHNMLHAVRHTSLRDLRLYDIVCDPNDLVNCLMAHKGTLRYLTLRRITASAYSWDWVHLISTLLDFQLTDLRLDHLKTFRDNISDILLTACSGPRTLETFRITSTESTRTQSGQTMRSTLLQTIQHGISYVWHD